MVAHRSASSRGRWFARSKDTLLSELYDTTIVVAKCIAQDVFRMLAQQGRSHRINRRRQAHVDGRLDVGDPFRRRVRNLAETVTLPRFGRIESLFDGAEIADRDIGQLHL